jgi:hypothetical protein
MRFSDLIGIFRKYDYSVKLIDKLEDINFDFIYEKNGCSAEDMLDVFKDKELVFVSHRYNDNSALMSDSYGTVSVTLFDPDAQVGKRFIGFRLEVMIKGPNTDKEYACMLDIALGKLGLVGIIPFTDGNCNTLMADSETIGKRHIRCGLKGIMTRNRGKDDYWMIVSMSENGTGDDAIRWSFEDNAATIVGIIDMLRHIGIVTKEQTDGAKLDMLV